MSADLKYRRVLLKVSGEALMGTREYGLDPEMVAHIADEVQSVHALGVELSLVIGGGNIFRGVSGSAVGMERASGDYIGMLATVINSLAVQNELEQRGVTTRVQSAISMQAICEPYIRRRAIRHLEKKAGRHLRRRDGQPVLHDRYRRGVASFRNGLRRVVEGDEGRWRL